MKNLKKTELCGFSLESGKRIDRISLFYQHFGQAIGSAPIVLVNHALTGNSNVAGENGWWKELIGAGKTIDTNYFSVISFNIPGNGFDGDPENLVTDYRSYTVGDISKMFWEGLHLLGIQNLFAIIGGSLGGAIAWEMAALNPGKIKNLIPVATDWKASGWVIANVAVQDKILNNSDDPIADARAHAMLLYRTPQSLGEKFGRNIDKKSVFKVENWLDGHGEKLKNRFRLSAYKLMNHLLKTIDITKNRGDFPAVAKAIAAEIHLIAVDTDYFFLAGENRRAYHEMKSVKTNVFYHEIKSIHGHDAFLIESAQLTEILNPIFNTQKQQKYADA